MVGQTIERKQPGVRGQGITVVAGRAMGIAGEQGRLLAGGGKGGIQPWPVGGFQFATDLNQKTQPCCPSFGISEQGPEIGR